MNPSSPSRPSVSVVVPTRGRRELLEKCLRSLLEQQYPRELYEVVVVEDGTDDARVVTESLRQNGLPVTYLRAPHGGAASTYDLGLDHARCEIVAFIDDDAIASADWLQNLANALVTRRGEGITGVGGRVSPDYPLEDLQAKLSSGGDLIWTGSNVLVSQPQDVDFLSGANMAFWRAALMKVGGFDRNFSRTISWRHETDVCLRIRRNGCRLSYDPGVLVFHRAARWTDPIDRVRPGIVSAMIRDDAYFRAKNFGWAGVGGAIKAALRDSRKRIVIGTANLLLAILHLVAWVPGAWKGLRRKNRQYGTLPPQ